MKEQLAGFNGWMKEYLVQTMWASTTLNKDKWRKKNGWYFLLYGMRKNQVQFNMRAIMLHIAQSLKTPNKQFKLMKSVPTKHK